MVLQTSSPHRVGLLAGISARPKVKDPLFRGGGGVVTNDIQSLFADGLHHLKCPLVML